MIEDIKDAYFAERDLYIAYRYACDKDSKEYNFTDFSAGFRASKKLYEERIKYYEDIIKNIM